MKPARKWTALSLGTGVAIFLILALVSTFTNGPVGPMPFGGPMQGALTSDLHPDWSNVGYTVTVQLDRAKTRSFTTLAIVHKGNLYIPSYWASKKTWPFEVEKDGRMLVRTGDKLYERQAVRIMDARMIDEITASQNKKIPAISRIGALPGDDTWWFRLDPRPRALANQKINQ